jgi:CBS domain containing-hemolysin-like protein
MTTVLGLLAVAALILANALFVASEFALVAVDRDRIERLAPGGGRRARAARWGLERLSFNLSGAQLGITVTSLVLGFIAEPTIAEALRPALGWLPEAARSGVAIAAALALATITQMVFGELIPKGLAVARPERTLLAVAVANRAYAVTFGPLIRFLNGAADRAVRRLGIEPREELRSVRTSDELELLIRSSGEEGTIDPEAFQLLSRAIRFGEKDATDALVPRVDMVTLPSDATVADLARLSLETGHSRFPVVGESADDVVGMAHAKDALRVQPWRRAETPLTDVVRTPTFVPETRDLESLLAEMRAGGVQMAVVVDEYGGVAGIVTLEDLLEEIVGDIEDEHDVAAPLTSSLPGTKVVEGTIHGEDLAHVTGFELPEGPYETLAGFLLDRLGHLPVPGELVVHEGWTFEVLQMDRRRIAAVRVRLP